MFDFLWILVQVISPIFGLVYALALSPWRHSKSKTLILAATLTSALTFVNFIAVKYCYPIVDVFPIFDFIYRMGNVILVAAIALSLIRGKAKGSSHSERAARILFTVLSVCVCIFVVDTIAITIRTIFGLYTLELLCELLLYPLMLLLVVRIRKPFIEVSLYMKKQLWLLSIVPASLMIIILMLISVPKPLEQNPENIPIALTMCVVTAAVYCTIFYLFKILRVQSNMEQNAIAMKLYSSSLEHQNEIVARNAQKAALFRHDLRHIAQLMYDSLSQGNITDVRELIGKLDKNVSDRENQVVAGSITGHKIIDAVLTNYMTLSFEAGIDFMINIEPPDIIKADKTELAVVIANALENAFNACEKIPVGENRTVRVDGHKQGRQYFLEITNTYVGEIRFDVSTDLPTNDNEGHGLGTQSVAFFAQKYGAELEYSEDKNLFHLRLLLR